MQPANASSAESPLTARRRNGFVLPDAPTARGPAADVHQRPFPRRRWKRWTCKNGGNLDFYEALQVISNQSPGMDEVQRRRHFQIFQRHFHGHEGRPGGWTSRATRRRRPRWGFGPRQLWQRAVWGAPAAEAGFFRRIRGRPRREVQTGDGCPYKSASRRAEARLIRPYGYGHRAAPRPRITRRPSEV